MTITGDHFTKAQPTILLVEDDAVVMRSIRLILILNGYQILLAEDGQKGLDLYLQHVDSIALVMTGLIMPKMDGPTMIRAILNRNPNQRIVIFSGIYGGANSDVVKCMMFLGVKLFISKSHTSLQHLINSIQTVLGETEKRSWIWGKRS